MNTGRGLEDMPIGVMIGLPGEFLRVEDVNGQLAWLTRPDGEQLPTVALELVGEPFADATAPTPQTVARTYVMTQEQWFGIVAAINDMFRLAYADLVAIKAAESG